MTELLHWIAHLVCAFLGVAGAIYIDDLKKQLAREKWHHGSTDATQQFEIPVEEAWALAGKLGKKKVKRVRKGKVVSLDAAKG